ncbi:unnamed protein product [Sphagnum troendelagicum]
MHQGSAAHMGRVQCSAHEKSAVQCIKGVQCTSETLAMNIKARRRRRRKIRAQCSVSRECSTHEESAVQCTSEALAMHSKPRRRRRRRMAGTLDPSKGRVTTSPPPGIERASKIA